MKLGFQKIIPMDTNRSQAKIRGSELAYSQDFWRAVALLRALVLNGHDERKLLEHVSHEVKRPKYRFE